MVNFAIQYDKVDQGNGVGHISGCCMPPADPIGLPDWRGQLVFDDAFDYSGKKVDLTDPENPVLIDEPPPDTP